MEEVIGYKKLKAWQKADELVFKVYSITTQFPKSEIFSLVNQLRRAALSVPTNIVEGYARNSRAEMRRFVVIALGSLAEVKYLLDVSIRLNYCNKLNYQEVIEIADETGKLLWGYYKSL